jgi:hypothetical protein
VASTEDPSDGVIDRTWSLIGQFAEDEQYDH